MADERTIYRNTLKELFKKYGIHRAIRSSTLNDLIDEVNTYYKEKETPADKAMEELGKFHEAHLKEQLNGWITYLNGEYKKIVKNPPEGDGNTAYGKGVIRGFEIVIQHLKDVAER